MCLNYLIIMLESLLNAGTKAIKYILFLSNFVFVVSRLNCILLRNLLSYCAIISVWSWNQDLDRHSLLWSWGKLYPHLEVTKNTQTKIFIGLYRLSGRRLRILGHVSQISWSLCSPNLSNLRRRHVGYWYLIINVTFYVSF